MAETELLLAIDQGGGSTRAATYTLSGELVGIARMPVATHRDADNRVEHDPGEILASLHRVVIDARRAAEKRGGKIVAAGLATQRSSIVCWDRRTGVALSPVISWQDRRAAAELENCLPDAAVVSEITGLVRSPHYGASKLHWCLAHNDAVARAASEGNLMFGPLSSFLLYHLLQERPALADPANASRTLLWDLRRLDWSDELLAAFGIARELLPKCVSSRFDFGLIRSSNIPLTVCTGDQNASIFANGPVAQGTAYINIGTGAFILARVRAGNAAPLLQSVAWSDGARVMYVQEGTVNGAGAALADMGATASEIKMAASQLGQKDVPLFLNGVSGLGSPYWQDRFASRFIGPGGQQQRLTAVLESILFLLQVNLELLQKRTGLNTIVASGGLAHHDALCQALADLSGLAVVRPLEAEATARGLAFLTAGLPHNWASCATNTFAPGDGSVISSRYDNWSGAMQDALPQP